MIRSSVLIFEKSSSSELMLLCLFVKLTEDERVACGMLDTILG